MITILPFCIDRPVVCETETTSVSTWGRGGGGGGGYRLQLAEDDATLAFRLGGGGGGVTDYNWLRLTRRLLSGGGYRL